MSDFQPPDIPHYEPDELNEAQRLRAALLRCVREIQPHHIPGDVYAQAQDALSPYPSVVLSVSGDSEVRRLLGEARCPADYCNGRGAVEQYRTGTGEIVRTNCTWCAVRAAALGWDSVLTNRVAQPEPGICWKCGKSVLSPNCRCPSTPPARGGV